MASFTFFYTTLVVLATYGNVVHSQLQKDSIIRVPVRASNSCSLTDIQAIRNSVMASLDDETRNRPCSCGGAGWTRVAYLDMSDPLQTCPSAWTVNTTPVRGCGRSSSGTISCDSVFYPVNGLRYSRVCGRITSYHKGFSDGFNSVYNIAHAVSGVSVIHGPPGARQHIWSFIVAENDIDVSSDNCPCSNTEVVWPYSTPSFLGNNYFCDTGRHVGGANSENFYTSSCCEFNSPPWFCRSLPQPTTDDLEIILCNRFSSDYADKVVTFISMYAQ